jgi:hypothetical protein
MVSSREHDSPRSTLGDPERPGPANGARADLRADSMSVYPPQAEGIIVVIQYVSQNRVAGVTRSAESFGATRRSVPLHWAQMTCAGRGP